MVKTEVEYKILEEHQFELWMEDLKFANEEALLGVLFLILSNLKDLRLGTSSLQHFAFLKNLLENPGKNLAWRDEPLRSSRLYTDILAGHIAPRLVSLDLPCRWSGYGMTTRHTRLSGDALTMYHCLRHLAVPYSVVFGQGSAFLNERQLPVSNLPKSIQTLVITDAERHRDALDFIAKLLDRKHEFRSLKEVKIFIISTPKLSMRRWLAQSECARVEQFSGSLGVNVRIRFPEMSWLGFHSLEANGQPWRYTEEELIHMEQGFCTRVKHAGETLGWERFKVEDVPIEQV
ncbi:hypothetical protein EJ04DRAFT_582300 [Polyplosphaeria fusca]|uniref:Uncharacterized protein n=1 Tax=Polyplosphaeria fusca TaxID=682080 RepID=A0A9P4USS6_9PLEO|nr:hypothetical protein EJ04DRAFT_582300 [Polyplosphaeria fusca]